MRSFTSSAVVEQHGPSNRRQPVRQTRNNPSRTVTTTTLTTGVQLDAQDVTSEEPPGFFPAITHFTDAITQLPKEMVRHYTLLKEVDGKTLKPEERLAQLLSTGLKAPVPKPPPSAVAIEPLPEPHVPESKDPRFSRRNHFREMRHQLHGLLLTLDEKNHVMTGAMGVLEKQLQRCQSSFPHIEEEISEEARLGSMTHWAYNTEKPIEKKGMMAGERTRRAANNLAVAEGDAAAVRSEARREALAARKGRNQNLDSDFDDNRPHSKKTQNGTKGRKAAEPAYGLGISSATAAPNKRRKVEQPVGGVAMARTTSSAYGTNARGTPPAVENKKKPRSGNTAVPNRRRNNTNTSAVHSPNLASSPIMGTFAASTKADRPRASPAPSLLQRIPSARNGHQHTASGSSRMQLSRNRSSSTNVQRIVNGGLHNNASGDVEKVSGLTGKSHTDIRNNMKETVNTKGEPMIEDNNDGASDMRGALVVARRGSDGNNTNSSRTRGDRPPSISVSTRGGNGNGISHTKNPSKTGSPLIRSFTTDGSVPRARPSRGNGGSDLSQPKRSHKKGAGIAAQRELAKQQAAHPEDEDGDVSMQEDELGSGELDPEAQQGEGFEDLYCYCNGPSHGEMVGCDAQGCEREWFHLKCVGLTKAPAKQVKWYCVECKERLRRT